MSDTQEISDLIARLLLAVDRLDWAGVRRAFSERVVTDYTSLFGGSVSELSADEVIAGWRQLLPGFDATQHLIGPVVVSANRGTITAETTVRGYHHLREVPGGSTWMVAGIYSFAVTAAADGWQIESMKLSLAYQEGNTALVQLARDRVAAGQTRRV